MNIILITGGEPRVYSKFTKNFILLHTGISREQNLMHLPFPISARIESSFDENSILAFYKFSKRFFFNNNNPLINKFSFISRYRLIKHLRDQLKIVKVSWFWYVQVIMTSLRIGLILFINWSGDKTTHDSSQKKSRVI